MENKIRKAVIPAAGLGTRFRPFTNTAPKEMLPVIDKPVIHYVIDEAIASGYDDLVVITNASKRSLEDYIDTLNADVCYVRQRDQKGLGDAILKAEKHIGGEPFAVLLGDTILTEPCLRDVPPNTIIVEKIPQEETVKYGVVKFEPMSGRITDLVEKPKPEEAPSLYGIIGRYTLQPYIFDCLKRTTPGLNGELQLTDALKLMAKTENIYAKEFTGKRYDLGDKFDYIRATIDFALMREEFSNKTRRYLCGL